jgi:hypothetical protein
MASDIRVSRWGGLFTSIVTYERPLCARSGPSPSFVRELCYRAGRISGDQVRAAQLGRGLRCFTP